MILNPAMKELRERMESANPILAANTFGPSLIRTSPILKLETR